MITSIEFPHGQWRLSPIKIDGYVVFESHGSYNVNNEYDIMRLEVQRTYTESTIDIYIGSYAESSYDYTLAFPLNYSVSSNSTSSSIASTSNKQYNPTNGISAFTKVSYTLNSTTPSGHIDIMYKKDGSVNNNNDRGYVAIPCKHLPLFFFNDTSESKTVSMEAVGGINAYIDFSHDMTTWMNYNVYRTHSVGASLSPNEYLFIRVNSHVGNDLSDVEYIKFNFDLSKVYGNTFSISHEYGQNDDFFDVPYCALSTLFYNCISLVDASNLYIDEYVNAGMCYNMFRGCSALVKPPVLQATVLAMECYDAMFDSCTSLTTAPELLAETLPSRCYNNMFYGCSSLNKITAHFTNAPGNSFTYNWVYGVASSGTFKKYGSWANTYGASAIPTGWGVENAIVITNYLTFTANTASSIGYTDGNGYDTIIYTSTDKTNWTKNIGSFNAISISSGNKLYVAGDNPNGMNPNDSTGSLNHFNITGNVSVSGNLLCMISQNISVSSTPAVDSVFAFLFYNCTGLTNASGLLLTATKLTNQRAYKSLFENCSYLTGAPALPATNLPLGCYAYTFRNCTRLTTAPNLPATTISERGYYAMFEGCTSLTTAPIISATTLTSRCCENMFKDCTSLTTAPKLLAETLVSGCYNLMFNGCTRLNNIECNSLTALSETYAKNWVQNVASSGTFIKNPNATWADSYSISEIPVGWSIKKFLTDAIKFTSLADSSSISIYDFSNSRTFYYAYDLSDGFIKHIGNMTFNNLLYGETLYIAGDNPYGFTFTGPDQTLDDAIDTAAYFDIKGDTKLEGSIMSLIGQRSTVDYDKLDIPYAFMGIFSSCYISDASDLNLNPTDLTGANNCYDGLFDSATLLFPPALPATTLAPECYRYMFAYCFDLDFYPLLPALTLAESCYAYMFEYTDCSEIVLPATSLANGCYERMFYNCTSLSTITCDSLTQLDENYSADWVYNVAPSGTFYKNNNARWRNNYNANCIPIGWNVIGGNDDFTSNIYIGQNYISECYIGQTKVKEIYIGQYKVF